MPLLSRARARFGSRRSTLASRSARRRCARMLATAAALASVVAPATVAAVPAAAATAPAVHAAALSNYPIVGMAPTPNAGGYWMAASDGGVFSFGDAGFHGSLGSLRLASPIVGMARTPDGRGYWLVASDGGVFAFGDAGFYGSTGGMRLAKPIVGMAATPDGRGYWLVGSDGGLFTFGDAGYHGSAVTADAASGASAVGVMAVGSGYWIPNNLGGVTSLGAPAAPSPSAPIVNSAAPAAGSPLPAGQNPAVSIDASSAQKQACWVPNPDVAACNSAALADIDRARAGEGLGPLVLPANFYSLGTVAQVLAVASAERTSRGLPAMPENANLDGLAAAGAAAGADPSGPGGYQWGSNIAWGDATALAADFGWMYDDGPGSPNIDCRSAGDSGCWGHRENILSPWGGASGAGVYVNNGTVQLTELFVRGY